MKTINILHALVVACVPVAMAIMLFSAGCSDTVACSTDKNCTPGYTCVDGACEQSSAATPTS